MMATPPTASSTKWLAEPSTTSVVAAGYSQASWRQRVRVVATTAKAHQKAQATCRLGMAAYRST